MSGPDCCDRPQPVEEYRPDLHARVTSCVCCGKELDRRPLRTKDEPGPSVCEKHGGELVACSSGPGRAHECHHSKFVRGPGQPRTFNGPCACYSCHRFDQ